MFSKTWQTSPRKFGIVIERDVRIPVSDGITLDSDIFRPDYGGRFPVLVAANAFNKASQSMEMMPEGFSFGRGYMESGDFNFYVRRGYAMIVVNVRGTFGSGGVFDNNAPRSIQDIYEVIEWAAKQPWSDGNVGMNGVSHFSRVAKRVAALKPPHLKALFSPYGWTDPYRDLYYHGGIFNYGFLGQYIRNHGRFFRIENTLKKTWGEEKYGQAIARALADPEIAAVPLLADALRNPDYGPHTILCDIILNHVCTDYHKQRTLDVDADLTVPGYFGGDWGIYGLHGPGDYRCFEHWKGPSKLTIGPPLYLDRPLYQYDYESLRWFDHWLKGVDTGIMDEAPVNVFIVGTDEWKSAQEWPLPETRWTPFYLHAGGLLSEHEFWPNEGFTVYEDSGYQRGSAMFRTPPMVEKTEICGPIVLNLYGSTTADEVLWFASLWHTSADGRESLLTRGWLRGSQRKLDAKRSRPWQPCHLHTGREPLKPDQIYEFNIEIRPYGIMLRAGERLGLKISGADNEPAANCLELTGKGHIHRQAASHVSIHHNAGHPSHLLLPVTRGNRIGTFLSGGKLPEWKAPA